MKRFIAILMTLIMVLGLSSVGVWADEATWQEETSMPTARIYHTSEVWNGKIYVFGGSNNNSGSQILLSQTEIYDTETDSWSEGASMPTARSFPVSAMIDDKIYVIGGYIGSAYTNKVEIYDPQTDSWTTGAPMPTAKTQASAAVVGGKIYVTGGRSLSGDTKPVEIYDPQTDSWTTGAPMSTEKSTPAISVVDDKIYVFGGNSSSGTLDIVEIYDPQNDSWTTGEPLPVPTHSMRAVAYSKKIYLVGGYNVENILRVYDTMTNTWDSGIPLPRSIYNHTAHIIGSKIYVLGGSYNGYATNTVFSLNLTDNPSKVPSSLNATGGDSVVDLSWDSVSDASYYNVKRSITAGGIYTTIASTSAITYTDSDVTNEITYYYVVSAVNDEGESIDSNQASATPQATATPEYVLAVLLNVDETVQLSVTYDLADNTNLTWTSSDGAIATVDGNGKVTAISEGLTYIYATNGDGSFKEFIPVKVVLGDADEMRLAVHLTAGEKALLYLTEDPSNVTWSSMDTSIATISAEGEITAVSKGLVIIQAELDGSIYQVYVRVNA